MKNILILLLLIFCINEGFSQKYSEHYYKRTTLFKGSVDTENEIIFLGNSITEGGDWKLLFPNYNTINRGISGDVTQGVLDRLEEIVSSKPIKVFLAIGTNDLARGESVMHIVTNCRLILKKILKDSENTKIYLQSVFPVNPDVGNKFSGHKNKIKEILEVNRQLIFLAQEFGVTYINLHKKFKNHKGLLKPKYTYDGLHLSPKGYLKWRNSIKKQMIAE
ncbi:MAG: GDSL-type esterase/lipase family protein [Cellulophaga sp.]